MSTPTVYRAALMPYGPCTTLGRPLVSPGFAAVRCRLIGANAGLARDARAIGLSGGPVRCPPIDRGEPRPKTPSRLSDGRYQEEHTRPGVILHAPLSHSGETQCRARGSLEWWPFCRACPQR